jgi:S1-C subfamily serine protease
MGRFIEAKVAEWVLASAAPYQLSHSVSLGIISALGRKNLGFSRTVSFRPTPRSTAATRAARW